MPDSAVDRLARALEGFAAAADRADPEAASRCAGWTNADVVEHVIGVTDRFAARARGSGGPPSPDVVTEIGRPESTVLCTELVLDAGDGERLLFVTIERDGGADQAELLRWIRSTLDLG